MKENTRMKLILLLGVDNDPSGITNITQWENTYFLRSFPVFSTIEDQSWVSTTILWFSIAIKTLLMLENFSGVVEGLFCLIPSLLFLKRKK
jgi:hypothetical protein